jgi:cytochrome c553
MSNTCQCVKNHSPKAFAFQVHHVVPTSWKGPNTDANKVTICGTCHDNTHTLLNLYVKHDGNPPAEEVRKFPKYSQELAKRAIAEVGGPIPHVYTLGISLEELAADQMDDMEGQANS